MNLGIVEDTELVVDFEDFIALGALEPGEPRVQVTDTDVLVKHVFREGVLQGKSGPSIAVEVGPLLPDIHGVSAFGASLDVITSYRWSSGSIHWNEWGEYTREHNFSFVVVSDMGVEGRCEGRGGAPRRAPDVREPPTLAAGRSHRLCWQETHLMGSVAYRQAASGFCRDAEEQLSEGCDSCDGASVRHMHRSVDLRAGCRSALVRYWRRISVTREGARKRRRGRRMISSVCCREALSAPARNGE